MATKLPHVTITEIPNTSPGATPGLWNTRYYEINENFDALSSYSPVGDCSTAAGTAAKAVTITNFELSKNAFVFVKFSAANTAANPTLNVTGTGAKAIYYQGAAVPASYLEANRYYHFVYDGSHWVLTGDVDVRFRYLPLTGGTLTGDLTVNTNLTVKGTTSLQAVTANKALTAKAGITSNTLTVTGATTLEGALAAHGGISTTTITATGTTTLAGLNASNIKASGTLTVNGSTTLKALGATNITASGTLAVSGATTLTGKLTANGGLTTKALTATSLDLNGNADISGTTLMTGKLTANGGIDTKAISATTLTTSGNATVGGLLAVTGSGTFGGSVTASGDVIRRGSATSIRYVLQNTALTKGTLPDASHNWDIAFVDSEGLNNINRAGSLNVRLLDGNIRTGICAYKWQHDATDVAMIAVTYNADGSIETYAPTPGSDASSNNIATVGWSDGRFLKLSGGTVTGTLTAARIIQNGSNPVGIVIPQTQKGTTPSETYSNGIDFFDADGYTGTTDRLGLLRVQYSSDGSAHFSIGATQPVSGSTTNSEIKVGWRLSGSSYEKFTEAPTPPTGDESTQIATTAFVGSAFDTYGLGMRVGRSGCGYVTDADQVPGSGFFSVAASASNFPVSTTCMLHVQRWADNGTSGFQIVPSANGSRLFTRIRAGSSGWGEWLPLVTQEWAYDFQASELCTSKSSSTVRVLAQNLSVVKGTAPTDGSRYWDFRACDSEGRNVQNSLGGMTVAYNTDGSVETRLLAYKAEHGVSTSTSIRVGYRANGDVFTQAPTPPADDNSTQIATTEWVLSHQKTSDTNAEKQVHFEAQDTRVGHKTIEPQFCEESLIPRA